MVEAPHTYFGLHSHALVCHDGILNVGDEVADVLGGSPACVHHEARVLGGDLSAAYLEALQPRILNELAGEVALGAFEVDPAEGISSGCFSSRRARRSSMRS